MATIPEALTEAIAHHRAGQLQRAEELYQQILRQDPVHVDALHLLGVIASQRGDHAAAITHITRAIERNPQVASFHSNLGMSYQALGRNSDAAECYRRALQLQPGFPEAHNNLGTVLMKLGDHPGAVASYSKAMELKPDYLDAWNNLNNALKSMGKAGEEDIASQQALQLEAEAATHNNRGNAFQKEGKYSEAVESYREALRLRPNHALALNNLGTAYKAQGKLPETIACYQRALQIAPDFAEAHNNLGAALREDGKFSLAIVSCRRAVELRADFTEAYLNLGNALVSGGELEEGIAVYDRALQMKPDFPEAHVSLGTALQQLGRVDDAILSYREAIRINRDYGLARFNLGMALLLRGDFEEGWREYESRWQSGLAHLPKLPFPPWDGSPLNGRTILLYAEQGRGDAIQFIRYARLLHEQGGKVVVGCPPELVELFGTCRGVESVFTKGWPADCACSAPLLSLPRLSSTTLQTIPSESPYLHASADESARWREEIGGVLEGGGWRVEGGGLKPLLSSALHPPPSSLHSRELKIGLFWQGDPRHAGDRQRSVPLQLLMPLAQIPGVKWYSLQKGAGTEQLALVKGSWEITALGDRLHTFSDTAALLSQLDLLITVDTAIAHLAGALGVPVWILLPFSPDWRWLLEREDSPWYPSAKLFRQKKRADWPEVISRLGLALGSLSASRDAQ